MKQLVHISILFILLTVSIFPQPWMLQNANVPSNAQPGHFSTVNDKCLLGILDYCLVGPDCSNGFLRTTDGGTTWSCDTISGGRKWNDILDRSN